MRSECTLSTSLGSCNVRAACVIVRRNLNGCITYLTRCARRTCFLASGTWTRNSFTLYCFFMDQRFLLLSLILLLSLFLLSLLANRAFTTTNGSNGCLAQDLWQLVLFQLSHEERRIRDPPPAAMPVSWGQPPPEIEVDGEGAPSKTDAPEAASTASLWVSNQTFAVSLNPLRF